MCTGMHMCMWVRMYVIARKIVNGFSHIAKPNRISKLNSVISNCKRLKNVRSIFFLIIYFIVSFHPKYQSWIFCGMSTFPDLQNGEYVCICHMLVCIRKKIFVKIFSPNRFRLSKLYSTRIHVNQSSLENCRLSQKQFPMNLQKLFSRRLDESFLISK